MKSVKHLYLSALLLLFPFISNAAIRYVTVSGAGLMDGSSWANAAPGTQLQAMINASVATDEVWVACGTYLPTAGNDRNISFTLRSGVSVYGSFAGTETMASERSFSCGPCSILSGEIGQPGISDNTFHVVYNEETDSSTVLDGFEIAWGNDDRSPTSAGNGLGGGLYNHGFGATGFSYLEVRNCHFHDNRASWGGGAFNNGYDGGDAEPTYINCVFRDNHAYVEAGGMDSYGVGGNASPTLYNCLFHNNTAATNVGAMFAWGGNAGGNSHPVLINCAFVGNRALNGYGGAFIATNIDENNTTSSGSCTVTLINCIVRGNEATGTGQQFYVGGNGAQVIATYSNIDMSGQPGPHILSGATTGNIDADPLYADPTDPIGPDNCWMTADDGLRTNGGPCLNAGTSAGVHATDLIRNPRNVGGAVDMGPYEQSAPASVARPQQTLFDVFMYPATGAVNVRAFTAGKLSIYHSSGLCVERASFQPNEEKPLKWDGPAGLYHLHFESSTGESAAWRVMKWN